MQQTRYFSPGCDFCCEFYCEFKLAANRDEKKRKLLEILKGKGKPRKKKAEDKTGTRSGATCSNKGKETSQRKIHLGWLHFDPS